MTQAQGKCPRCGDANSYTDLVCSGCGARLPWADAVSSASNEAAAQPKHQARQKATRNIQIGETKCTCLACGHVWFFGKKQIEQNNQIKSQDVPLACCGTMCFSVPLCCWPFVFMMNRENIVTADKCPKCRSKNVQTEELIHHV